MRTAYITRRYYTVICLGDIFLDIGRLIAMSIDNTCIVSTIEQSAGKIKLKGSEKDDKLFVFINCNWGDNFSGSGSATQTFTLQSTGNGW